MILRIPVQSIGLVLLLIKQHTASIVSLISSGGFASLRSSSKNLREILPTAFWASISAGSAWASCSLTYYCLYYTSTSFTSNSLVIFIDTSLFYSAKFYSVIINCSFSLACFSFVSNSIFFSAKLPCISFTFSSVSCNFYKPVFKCSYYSSSSLLFSPYKLTKCLMKSKKSLGVMKLYRFADLLSFKLVFTTY